MTGNTGRSRGLATVGDERGDMRFPRDLGNAVSMDIVRPIFLNLMVGLSPVPSTQRGLILWEGTQVGR